MALTSFSKFFFCHFFPDGILTDLPCADVKERSVCVVRVFFLFNSPVQYYVKKKDVKNKFRLIIGCG